MSEKKEKRQIQEGYQPKPQPSEKPSQEKPQESQVSHMVQPENQGGNKIEGGYQPKSTTMQMPDEVKGFQPKPQDSSEISTPPSGGSNVMPPAQAPAQPPTIVVNMTVQHPPTASSNASESAPSSQSQESAQSE